MSYQSRSVRISAALLLAVMALVAVPVQANFTQTYQASGHLGLTVGGAANLGMPAMGTITLPSTPMGIIKQAYLYATQTNNTLGLSATFGMVPLGVAAPYDTESLLITISTYRWDVTSMIISGVATYGVSFLDASSLPVAVPAAALVVVWEDTGTQPTRTITIVDGVRQVGENGAETESLVFSTLPSGSTSVWIFTTDDDVSLGEIVTYNSAVIGGPLVGNLGLNGSVLQMSSNSVAGSDTLAVSTTTDHFSWVLGATAVDLTPVSVEESGWTAIKELYR